MRALDDAARELFDTEEAKRDQTDVRDVETYTNG